MSIERLAATPPLTRSEAGLWIINYIRGYEERREKASRLTKFMEEFGISGAIIDGGNVTDPRVATAEQLIVNSWLRETKGIDDTVERRGSIIPVYLLEWRGPDKKEPGQHNWAAYPRDYWDDYQRRVWDASQQSSPEPVPKPADPLEVDIDLDVLHQKVWQSLQP